MKNYSKKGALSLLSCMLLLTACEKETIVQTSVDSGPGSTTLVFDARYGDADFELNKAYDFKLSNATGQFDLKYEFSQLRYWVSNVRLVNAAGEEFKVPESYYLIEENVEIPVQEGSFDKKYPANKREQVQISSIPAGDYTAIKFAVGVDSKYNDNLTLRAGELSSLNGMAFENWMWFTSYKFFVVNGKMTWVKAAPEAPASQTFFWDFASNNLYTEKEIKLDKAININAQMKSNINLELDVKKVIDIENPWSNRLISASKKKLMTQLKDNLLTKAITLKSTSSTAIAK
jgi:hypothetical protein